MVRLGAGGKSEIPHTLEPPAGGQEHPCLAAPHQSTAGGRVAASPMGVSPHSSPEPNIGDGGLQLGPASQRRVSWYIAKGCSLTPTMEWGSHGVMPSYLETGTGPHTWEWLV